MANPNEPVLPGVIGTLATKAWQTVLLIGIASLVVGVIILVWPTPSLLVAGVLFGIYLIVSGILQIVGAFAPFVGVAWRILAVISGVLSFVLAFFCFRHIGDSVVLLALWIGITWIIRGISMIISGIEASSVLPGSGWTSFYGVLVLLGGIVLFLWPVNSIGTLTLVVGIWLAALGIADIIYSFTLRSASKKIPAAL